MSVKFLVALIAYANVGGRCGINRVSILKRHRAGTDRRDFDHDTCRSGIMDCSDCAIGCVVK